jgi:hypothetical protein
MATPENLLGSFFCRFAPNRWKVWIGFEISVHLKQLAQRASRLRPHGYG